MLSVNIKNIFCSVSFLYFLKKPKNKHQMFLFSFKFYRLNVIKCIGMWVCLYLCDNTVIIFIFLHTFVGVSIEGFSIISDYRFYDKCIIKKFYIFLFFSSVSLFLSLFYLYFEFHFVFVVTHQQFVKFKWPERSRAFSLSFVKKELLK